MAGRGFGSQYQRMKEQEALQRERDAQEQEDNEADNAAYALANLQVRQHQQQQRHSNDGWYGGAVVSNSGSMNPGMDYRQVAGYYGHPNPHQQGMVHRQQAMDPRYQYPYGAGMPPSTKPVYASKPDPPAAGDKQNSSVDALLKASEYTKAAPAQSRPAGNGRQTGGDPRMLPYQIPDSSTQAGNGRQTGGDPRMLPYQIPDSSRPAGNGHQTGGDPRMLPYQIPGMHYGRGSSQPVSGGMARGASFPQQRSVPMHAILQSQTAQVARKRPAQQPPTSSIHHLVGAAFDGAETAPPRKKPKSMKAVKALPTQQGRGGGIFDDADEDMSFDSPPKGMGALPMHPGAKPSKNAKKKKKEKGIDKDIIEQKQKKKPVKPTKRVLVARKEKDLATSHLAGKEDLMCVLDPKHCQFLGREFWIFTVQQLDHVLQSSDEPENAEDPKTKRELSFRDELLLHVANSDLVSQSAPQVTQKSKEEKQAAAILSAEGKPEKKEEAQTESGAPASGEAKILENKETPSERSASADGAGKIENKEAQTKPSASLEGSHRDIVSDTVEVATEKVPLDLAPIRKEEKSEFRLKEATSRDIDPKAKEQAEAILRTWDEKMEAWKNKDPVERDLSLEKKFPLDGPIACLFPTVVLRFLASVPIRTLYDFLCLKKTETGAIIPLFGVWRKACGLVEGNPLALAKHLLGMCLRAEKAITSVPPADPRTRSWMGDPVIVLTGAAREFLVEHRKIFSGAIFIETRTKDLATALEEWRTQKGLPPLKGSGKVAMISGWKSNVKEAIDLEEGEGKVLHGVNLQAMVEAAEKVPIVQEEKKIQTTMKQTSYQEYTFDPSIPDVKAALHSEKFLQHVLDPRHFAVLRESGIKTAVDLFTAQKIPGSPLALAVSKILPDPSAFELVIFDWCQVVRKRLSCIRRVHGKRKGDPLAEAPAPMKPKKDPPAAKKKDPPASTSMPNRDLTAFNTRKDPPAATSKGKYESIASTPKAKDDSSRAIEDKKPVPSAIQVKKENSQEGTKVEGAPRPSKEELLEKDPFFSLSAVTQTFLGSLGISTAEAFMHSRTTDLSSAFVEWRAKNNMTVLKGLGAIASVSGWKAQVRKMATERGLDDLAQAAPQGIHPTSPAAKPKSESEGPKEAKEAKDPKVVKSMSGVSKKKAVPQARLIEPPGSLGGKKVLSYPEILFGKPTKKLVVESSRDPRLRFYFQLSIRKKPSGIGLFITFLGARKLQTVYRDYARVVQPHVSVIGNGNDYSDVSMPVAKDLSKKIKKDPHSNTAAGKPIRVPFSTQEDGCGMLELCRHDVWPLPCQGEVERVFPAIKSFILGQDLKATEISYSSNVTVGKDENGKSQYFLFLQKPFEIGQTLEVRFCSPLCGQGASADASVASKWRQRVEEMILRLSRLGMQDLLKKISCFVADEVEPGLQKSANDKASNSSAAAGGEPAPTTSTMVVARRRAHWVASRIMQRLQDMKGKGGARAVGADVAAAWNSVAWTLQLIARLKAHPDWTESIAAAIENEVQEELDEGIESSDFCNAISRKRWCSLAIEVFGAMVKKVKRFSSLLDESYSQESLVKEIRQLCVEFTRSLKGAQGGGLESLLLSFQGNQDTRLDSSPSRSTVFQSSVSQAYMDALALCGESTFGVDQPDIQRVIAATEIPVVESPKTPETPLEVSSTAPGTSAGSEAVAAAPPTKDKSAAPKEPPTAQFRVLDDIKRDFAGVNEAWYIRYQLIKVLEAVLSCSSLLLENGVPFKTFAMKEARGATTEAVSDDSVMRAEATSKPVFEGTAVVFPCAVDSSEYTPKSLPLFLGLVWPTLRSSHWRVEAGETPNDVVFLPPGQRGRKQKGDKNARMQKQERTRSRMKLAKASNDIGLGIVPKLTKRLFINAVEKKAGNADYNESPSVSAALELFLEQTTSEISEDNVEGKNRAELVVDFVKKAFDEIYPMLLSDDTNQGELSGGQRPIDVAGCEYLIQFLLVLPSILRQAKVSLQLIDDTTMVAKELSSFLTAQHANLFEARYHPTKEEYVGGDRSAPSSLSSCLENLRSSDSSQSLEIAEAILPEDRPDLTDFVEIVMSQVVPCRATHDDVTRKNRRIGVGFAGLMCRHCSGVKEGRYFFTSIESMTTAATVIEKHIQKCTLISPEIKSKMAEYRSHHADQRKHLAPGAQAAYFLRLWERLRSSKVRNTAASLEILQMTEKQDEDTEDGTDSLEFECHVRLLEYVRNVQPWSEKPGLLEGVTQYYECIETGGKIVGTDEMPKNFSSEWLLSRVSTKPAEAPSSPSEPVETSPARP